MNKNIPWNLIISHLKQELNQEDEDKLRKWLQIPKNTNLYKELETLWNEVRKTLYLTHLILSIFGLN